MVSINQTATLYQTISCFLHTPNKAWRKRSESINFVISLVLILLLRLYRNELKLINLPLSTFSPTN